MKPSGHLADSPSSFHVKPCGPEGKLPAMKIALAQFNPVVGDVAGNAVRSKEFIARAAQAGARLVVFGELSIVGYPPRDLLRKENFVADSVEAVESLTPECKDIAALVGFVRPTSGPSGRALQNAAALLSDGKVQHVYAKRLLPTYDVFDETRYFEPGDKQECFDLDGVKIGLTIGEDLWDAPAPGRDLHEADPPADLAAQGPQVIINMAASPYEMDKAVKREEMFARQGARSGAMIIYVSQVGGNDELIFDGASCAIQPDGKVVARAGSFTEDLLVVDTSAPGGRCEELGQKMQRLSAALKLGLRDYVNKCGFSSVVLGLSGGIDSAVVATLAVDALGPQNVKLLIMPSRYTRDQSLSDAKALAANLGAKSHVLSIEPMHAASEGVLAETLAGGSVEIAAENIQAPIRGNMVMAVSNAHGDLALATGNKSELSVGYCTLYGDMCGALAPIGDVLKTEVYDLARQLNAEGGPSAQAGGTGGRIPPAIIEKAPSAELKANQFDQDSLPPYDMLDGILRRYVERGMTRRQIISEGFEQIVVNRVVTMVDAAEHKRKQAPPVLKVAGRAFGTGRRMPIAQRYTHDGGP